MSLDLKKNLSIIQKSSQAEGGRGGEFFIFTFDNKYIIKTLSDSDFLQIKKNLQDYYEHLLNNENTLISKILGIYSYKSNNDEINTSVLIMKNLSGCEKKFVKRTYDVKGSTFQRNVQ